MDFMHMPFIKEAFGAAALALTFIAFIPYYRTIIKGETRPHIFSWFIWGVGTVIIFVAQLSDGGGIGAWPIGISGLLTLGVALLALRQSADRSITRIDWVFLILAGSALPLWFITSTALTAVIVLTIVDLLGFGPTIRKAYVLPYEENVTFFGMALARNGFVIAALEHYSWTTVLFPAAIGVACALFTLLIIARRAALGRP